jgi:hypothetical protein
MSMPIGMSATPACEERGDLLGMALHQPAD